MTTPETTPRTVRVRIAVAVDGRGKWSSFGYSDYTDEAMRSDIFVDKLEEGECFHWIEADVPIPERPAETVIEGTVERGAENCPSTP